MTDRDALTALSKKMREALKPFLKKAKENAALVARGYFGKPVSIGKHGPWDFDSREVITVQQWLDLDAALAVSPALTTTTGVVLTVPEHNRLRAVDAGEFQAGYYPYGHPERCLLRDDGNWACHKRVRHHGACSTHNDCGETKDGIVCGLTPNHEGRHAWEDISRQAYRDVLSAAKDVDEAVRQSSDPADWFIPLSRLHGVLALAVSPSLSAEQEALAASCGDVAPVARELLQRMRAEADAELIETICKRVGQPDLFGTEGERKLRAALAVSPPCPHVSLIGDCCAQCGQDLSSAALTAKALAVSPEPPPSIDCPLCGVEVKQVASATLSIALWQHTNWACEVVKAHSQEAEKRRLAVSGEGRTPQEPAERCWSWDSPDAPKEPR